MKSASKKTYFSQKQMQKYYEKKFNEDNINDQINENINQQNEEIKGKDIIKENKSNDEYSEEEIDSKDIGNTLEESKESIQGSMQEQKQVTKSQRFFRWFGSCFSVNSKESISKKKPSFNQNFQNEQQKYKEQIDTNVFNIQLGLVADKNVQIATGDPIYCQDCQSVLSYYSKVEKNTWICEFCNFFNDVNLDPEEYPKQEAVNYILQVAPEQQQNSQDIAEQTVIFCIDVSGSMRGKRLDYIKKAIQAKLKEMHKEKKINYKVGLILFESNVHLIGDGTQDPIIYQEENLDDYDFLLNNSIQNANLFDQPLEKTYENLQQKLKGMKTLCSTALGPGLLSSITIAGQGKPGSIVILCTDGYANVGLGSLYLHSQDFYDNLGNYAAEKGVMVNLITFSDSESNIQVLSRVPDLTGGSVEMIDLQNNQNVYQNLNMKIIATNVELKIKLHKGLEFRNENFIFIDQEKNIYRQFFGNITDQTEKTFEYRLKPASKLIQIQDIDFTQLKQIPFQIQITYQTLNRAKYLRVITQCFQISQEKSQLRKEADYEILGLNAIQKTSYLAKQGQIRDAQAKAKAWNNVMKSNINSQVQKEQLNSYQNNMKEVYGALNEQYLHRQEFREEKQKDSVAKTFFAGSKINTQAFKKGGY